MRFQPGFLEKFHTLDLSKNNGVINQHMPCLPSSLSLYSAKADGRSCEYNGKMYQNGENFRAGCKHQCTCIDGAVGCVPLCPSHLPLASPSCPAPRMVKVPGQCCLSVDCHQGGATTTTTTADAAVAVAPGQHRLRAWSPAYNPYHYPYSPYPAYPFYPFPKSPYRKLDAHKYKKQKKEDELLGNELAELQGRKWDKLRGNKHLAGERGWELVGWGWVAVVEGFGVVGGGYG